MAGTGLLYGAEKGWYDNNDTCDNIILVHLPRVGHKISIPLITNGEASD